MPEIRIRNRNILKVRFKEQESLRLVFNVHF